MRLTYAVHRARAWVQDALIHDEQASRRFEQIGAFTLADKLDDKRTDDDVVAVQLPLGPGQLRAHRVKMYAAYGEDRVATAIRDGGLNGFEPPTPELFVRLVRVMPGMVYDVGANSGLYALLAVEARPGTRAVCFEPYPPAVHALRRNIAMSRFRTRIEVVCAAVDDVVGHTTLFVPPGSGSLETSASLNGTFKDDVGEELRVPTTTLDAHWIQQGRPRVALVKIDTESTEHRVLDGGSALMRSQRPIVVCEVLWRGDGAWLRDFADRNDLVDVRMTPDVAVVGDEIRYEEASWNHLFVPREPIALVRDVLVDAGISVIDA